MKVKCRCTVCGKVFFEEVSSNLWQVLEPILSQQSVEGTCPECEGKPVSIASDTFYVRGKR